MEDPSPSSPHGRLFVTKDSFYCLQKARLVFLIFIPRFYTDTSQGHRVYLFAPARTFCAWRISGLVGEPLIP